MPRGTVCFARKLGIGIFQREKYYLKLQTKAWFVSFKTVAFLIVTNVG